MTTRLRCLDCTTLIFSVLQAPRDKMIPLTIVFSIVRGIILSRFTFIPLNCVNLFHCMHCTVKQTLKPTSKFSEKFFRRSKRLFFVSTTSSTSTVVTALTCYLTKAALVVCGKRRKKRSYLEESNDEQPTSLAEGAINPAR